MKKQNKKVRIPHQKRSIKTKEQITKTALRIFSQKGYFNTSSNEIAGQAGVSVGSFYAYFENKKQLFLEVVKYYNRRILNEIKPDIVLEGKNLKESLLNFITNILQAHKIHPEFHQEIMALYLLDSDVRQLVDDQNKNELAYAYKYLKARNKALGNQIKVRNLQVASFIIYNLVEKVVHEIAFSDIKIAEDRIIKEVVSVILKYILCDLPKNPRVIKN
jgi:AcrR family transcriptional regulator